MAVIKHDNVLTVNESRFDGMVNAFLKSQDIRETTKRGYCKALKEFFKFITEKRIINPEFTDILSYKKSLNDKGLTALSISAYLVPLRQFFKWLEISNLYKNVTLGIKGMKQPKGFRKDPLTRDQAIRLLSSIKQTDLIGKRDYAIIGLMVFTGLRCIEIQRANVEDIRQVEGRTVLYIQGKGRDVKDEFVILDDFVLNALNNYLRERKTFKDKDPLFIGCSNRNRKRLSTTILSMTVKSRMRAVGLNNPRMTAHSLRHTTATFCLKGGGSLQEVQQLLRHSSIDTTLIYSHNLDRIANNGESKVMDYFNNITGSIKIGLI